MAIIRANEKLIRMEAVVSATPTTIPGTFDDVLLTSASLQDSSRSTSTTQTSVNSNDGTIYRGTPVNEVTYAVTALADDASTQLAALQTLSDNRTLVWVQAFDTVATPDTVASGDKARTFQAYVSNLTITWPNNDVANISFDLPVDNANGYTEQTVTIS